MSDYEYIFTIWKITWEAFNRYCLQKKFKQESFIRNFSL